MARPQRCRRICREPEYVRFGPWGCEDKQGMILTMDEFESIRLMDLEGRTHEQCAAQMDISRTTVTEIYESARRKIARCLVEGLPFTIQGGRYRLCDGAPEAVKHCGKGCAKARAWQDQALCTENMKGAMKMKIAVTYQDGQVFQHFGHTQQFMVYQVEDGQVTGKQLVDASGSGHSALAGLLKELGAEVLICGGIGGGARTALAQAGLRLYGGVHGDADVAVQALLKGNLSFDPDAHCDHHGHGHEHGHTCGEHGCGKHHHEHHHGHGCGHHGCR